VLAVINLAFDPFLIFGNTPTSFYAPNGWGTTALTGLILSLWIFALGIALFRTARRGSSPLSMRDGRRRSPHGTTDTAPGESL